MSQTLSKITDKSTSYSVQQTAHEESWKLQYDIYKHLTTLSTGSILLLITFLEKLFARPIWKWLVIVAPFFFYILLVHCNESDGEPSA